MNCEKTILRNRMENSQDETNKINQVLPYISTNDITKINEPIYTGTKLVCENIRIPSKSTKKESKPGWEIWLETQIKIYKNRPKL